MRSRNSIRDLITPDEIEARLAGGLKSRIEAEGIVGETGGRRAAAEPCHSSGSRCDFLPI